MSDSKYSLIMMDHLVGTRTTHKAMVKPLVVVVAGKTTGRSSVSIEAILDSNEEVKTNRGGRER